jgi:hypothetical protein
MAQLKVYTFHPYHVYDKRIENILTEPRSQTRYNVYVSAYSKAAAVNFAKFSGVSNPSESELRLAQGDTCEALREATLFDKDGVVLVTSDRGGKKPVVLADQESQDDEPGTGSQAIGTLRPADGRRGQIFEATTAKYAGRGSVAVGAVDAYIKNLPDIWSGTNGQRVFDAQLQHLLDMGELHIIRSGFGDWFHAGR